MLSRRGFLALSAAISAEALAKEEPEYWTAAQARAALRRRAISSTELTSHCLGRIKRLDSKLNSFITLNEESALKEARRCDDRLAKRGVVPGAWFGIPIAIKDNIDTAGVRTTAAAQLYRDRMPTQDAEVVRRLKAAAVVCLGKLNLDEFAFEGTGTTSFFGPVHNPWNLDRITGGSSAGSAAALAAGLCYGSIGSDDGGSVRIPASYCGVVGFKTSYGRVSTRGIIPSAYSLDTVGPMTRSVEDAASMLQVIAGFDPEDSLAADRPVPDYTDALREPIANLRLGIPRLPFFDGLDSSVTEAIEEAIRVLRPHVREIRDVTLPQFEFVKDGSYDVELLHYHAPMFRKSPELYHPWSRRQLSGLEKTTALNYVETLKRLRECRRDIGRFFETTDLLVLPTMRNTAPDLRATMEETYKRPGSNVAAFNRFGLPAISIPCGFSNAGLPIGLQIVGPAFGEGRVLSLAYRYQELTAWHKRRPVL